MPQFTSAPSVLPTVATVNSHTGAPALPASNPTSRASAGSGITVAARKALAKRLP